MAISDRVRAVLERRRSNAAGPHKLQDRYVRPSFAEMLAEWEEDRDYWEAGELHNQRNGQ